MKSLRTIGLLLPILLTGCSGSALFSWTTQENPPQPVPTTVPDVPINGQGGTDAFGAQIPSAPVLSDITTFSQNSISLAWSDVLYEAGYAVWRKTGDSGTYAELIRIDEPNETAYVDSSASDNTTYCYKVKAYNMSGESPLSNEECATTPNCINSAGPTLTVSAASPARQYPTYRNTEGGLDFNKSNSVRIQFTVNTSDGCRNSFDWEVQVWAPWSTTAPHTRFTPENNERGPGTKTKWFQIPTDTSDPYPPQGSWKVVITASDGERSAESVRDDYFTVLTIPDVTEDETPPTLTSLSTSDPDNSVCAREPYTVTATFDDDSLPLFESNLRNGWLKTTLSEDGTLRRTEYNRTISRTFSTTDNPSVPLQKVYNANALDFALELTESSDITVTVNPDVDSPVFVVDEAVQNRTRFPAPAGGELQVGNPFYAIVGVATDAPCPAGNLRYRFEFRENITGAVTLIRDYGTYNANSTSFIPDGINPPVGTQGYIAILAKDLGNHETTIVGETLYTIVPSHIPQLTISTDPESGLSANQLIDVHLTLVDDVLTGATLQSLEWSNDGINYNPIEGAQAFDAGGEMVFPWQIPILAGTYWLSAELTDAEANTVRAVLSVPVTADDVSFQILYLDLDLNGEMPFDEIVNFNIDADGDVEVTSWLNPFDGYVILDRDGDGIVDDIYDFAFLQELLDEAGDVIDDEDALFSALRIWRDANSNGLTNSGELLGLDNLEIIDITLEPCCSFRMMP